MPMSPVTLDLLPQCRIPESDAPIGRARETVLRTVIVPHDIDRTGMSFEAGAGKRGISLRFVEVDEYIPTFVYSDLGPREGL